MFPGSRQKAIFPALRKFAVFVSALLILSPGPGRARAGVSPQRKVAPFASAPASKTTPRAAPSAVTLLTQDSLTDTPEGPKAQLRKFGIMPDVWVTQIYQGQPTGSASKVWRYGGKMDAFLQVEAEKLGLWRGFYMNAQFEHYIGDTIINGDFTLLPVSVAQAFVQPKLYKSALSIFFRQELGAGFSVAAGKVNTITLASETPLVGGGGIETFMNRAFAAPSTGIGLVAPGSLADRVIVAPTYTLGADVTHKSRLGVFNFAVVDPRNAQEPRVIQNPFKEGVVLAGSWMIPTQVLGLKSFHTLRAAYSNTRGFDLDDIGDARQRFVRDASVTKKGFWLASYAVQQYLFQRDADPSIGWGLFGFASISDGNPNPVKWSMLAGLAGNNLAPGRERDRWGVGVYHYELSAPLVSGLAENGVYRRSESGVEAFYNYAITPWLRLTADIQIIDPWVVGKSRATFMATRLQTKF